MKNLRFLRKNKNITMKELGMVISVSESAISQYENGKREPDVATIELLANYFDVTIDYLLGRTDASSELKIPPNLDGVGVAFYDKTHLTQGDVDELSEYVEILRARRLKRLEKGD